MYGIHYHFVVYTGLCLFLYSHTEHDFGGYPGLSECSEYPFPTKYKVKYGDFGFIMSLVTS